MSDVGEGCFPTTKCLAEETGLSERAVCEHIQAAIDGGWLMRFQHGFRGQKWRRNEYRPAWPDRVTDPPGDVPEGTDGGSAPSPEKALTEGQHLQKGTDGGSVEGTDPPSVKALTEGQQDNTSQDFSDFLTPPTPQGAGRGGMALPTGLQEIVDQLGDRDISPVVLSAFVIPLLRQRRIDGPDPVFVLGSVAEWMTRSDPSERDLQIVLAQLLGKRRVTVKHADFQDVWQDWLAKNRPPGGKGVILRKFEHPAAWAAWWAFVDDTANRAVEFLIGGRRVGIQGIRTIMRAASEVHLPTLYPPGFEPAAETPARAANPRASEPPNEEPNR